MLIAQQHLEKIGNRIHLVLVKILIAIIRNGYLNSPWHDLRSLLEQVPAQKYVGEVGVGIYRMILGGVVMHVLLGLDVVVVAAAAAVAVAAVAVVVAVVARLAMPSPSLSPRTICPGVPRGGLRIEEGEHEDHPWRYHDDEYVHQKFPDAMSKNPG